MTPPDLAALAGRRYLVTGGTGFVGSFVVEQLVQAGAGEVVVLDTVLREGNVARPLASGRVRLVEGDIRDPAGVAAAVEGMDGVFHMAVLPLGPCQQDPRLCVDVNIVGTFNVVEAAHRGGVGKVVYSSASSVYGDTLETTDESHPFNARTMYGASKLAGELFLRAFNEQHGLDYVALRYMNVYGPRQEGGLIMNVIRRLLAGERPTIVGDGSQSFDFVHVADVARANLAAMASDVADEAMNVGSGGEASVREIVEKLIALTGSGVEPEYRTDQKAVMTRRVGTNDRLRTLLGWEPTLDLEAGLADVIAWERAR